MNKNDNQIPTVDSVKVTVRPYYILLDNRIECNIALLFPKCLGNKPNIYNINLTAVEKILENVTTIIDTHVKHIDEEVQKKE